MRLTKDTGIKISVFIVCLAIGIGFAKFYQPQGKTLRIYKQALKDYENKNYSNSYYLFAKIGYLSELKPYALYHQAMSAKVLGDKQSELISYQKLFKYFPNNKLSPEAKYQAAQLLVDDNPDLALKYFNSVEKSNLDENYKIATKYYKARIETSKIRYLHKKVSQKEKFEIENAFRNYIKKVPEGRLAPSVVGTWLKFNDSPKSKDRALMARAYTNFKMYKQAKEILQKAKPEDKWAIQAVNDFYLNNFESTKTLTQTGVEKYSNITEKEDYQKAVDAYLEIFEPGEKLKYINNLLSLAKGKNKDYIWNLKCENLTGADEYSCYRDLYINFPNSEYAQNALVQVFKYGIKNRNYEKCAKLAKDFLEKYPSSEYVPLFLFWSGKIEQSYGNPSYVDYYENLINNYPDSYYAYRAFWILKRISTSVINAQIGYKPVEYPYKFPSKGDSLYTLMLVDDYDLISKIAKDDFIDSWIEYKKGNYGNSVSIAQKAMNKLQVKPVKSDLRWRLVYPQNYYRQIQNYAQKYKNNEALILAIIRTESTFNSEAQSSVGAIGLMQLMPATAHEIGSKGGLTFNTSYLFNPELNVQLGNMYYSNIRMILEGKDVSAVAAYNGGIGAVTKWKSNLKYNDTDEFIEQIPYEETKNYVEKVFGSYWNYVRIYQNQS